MNAIRCETEKNTQFFILNLKKSDPILIIFSTHISDNLPSNGYSVPHLTQCLLLHYLGKEPTKYCIFIHVSIIA